MRRFLAAVLAGLVLGSTSPAAADFIDNPTPNTITGTLTTNRIPRASGANTLADGSLTDTGSTVTSTVPVQLPDGAALVATTDDATDLFAAERRGRSAYFGTSLLINTTAALGLDGSVPTSSLGIISNAAVSNHVSLVQNGVNATGITLNFFKTRSTATSPGIAVASGDDIVLLGAFAADGSSSYKETSRILQEVDTYTAADNVSGRIGFFTRPSGAAGALVERWRIGPTGKLETIAAEGNIPTVLINTYSQTGAGAEPMLDLSGTWNTSGAPAAIKLVITDTASDAGSLLMDLGTTALGSMLKVGKVTNADLDLMDQLHLQVRGKALRFTQARMWSLGAAGQLIISNAQQTGFDRLVLGTDDTSGVALVKTATDLKVALGGGTDGGTFTVTGLKTTGAASGKKVVCVDIATGTLYASSTGTDCLN